MYLPRHGGCDMAPPAQPAPTMHDQDDLPVVASAAALALPPSLPLIFNARDLAPANDRRFIDVAPTAPASPAKPKKDPKTRGTAVLRGLKELRHLQKQTSAALKAVKTSLDGIQQVL